MTSGPLTLACILLLTAFQDCVQRSPSLASAYPYAAARKVDPFVALANTLRQQEQDEQRRLQEQQQFQDGPYADGGYFYDYGVGREAAAAPRRQPSDEDVLRVQQFQRLLSRAAMMPFFGRQQRATWADYDAPLDQAAAPATFYDRDETLPLVEDDGDFGWSAPVAGDNNEWRVAGEDDDEWRDADLPRDNQQLLDTLSEYMMLYDGTGQNAAAKVDDDLGYDGDDEEEQIKRAAATGNQNRAAGTKDQQNKGETGQRPQGATSEPDTTPATTTTATATVKLQAGSGRGDGANRPAQPPVQRSRDGTPLGQKEFPMMRPATPPRNTWFTNHASILSGPRPFDKSGDNSNNAAKRHAKNFAQLTIVMPEDELTEELDNLKSKHN